MNLKFKYLFTVFLLCTSINASVGSAGELIPDLWFRLEKSNQKILQLCWNKKCTKNLVYRFDQNTFIVKKEDEGDYRKNGNIVVPYNDDQVKIQGNVYNYARGFSNDSLYSIVIDSPTYSTQATTFKLYRRTKITTKEYQNGRPTLAEVKGGPNKIGPIKTFWDSETITVSVSNPQ